MDMTTLIYRRLEGMALGFVSGVLEQDDAAKTLSYTVTFRMELDFTHFKVTSKAIIPDYLDTPTNAIRPELGGLAYHFAYNYFFSAAGNINSSKELCDVFADPRFYMHDWSATDLQHRYHQPEFTFFDGQVQLTARRDYRWTNGRQVEITDLPPIPFDWSLNIMQGHRVEAQQIAAPGSVALLGYVHPEFVDVGNVRMRKGTRYMIGSTLQLGGIVNEQILTA
jgi:hypothetical protein